MPDYRTFHSSLPSMTEITSYSLLASASCSVASLSSISIPVHAFVSRLTSQIVYYALLLLSSVVTESWTNSTPQGKTKQKSTVICSRKARPSNRRPLNQRPLRADEGVSRSMARPKKNQPPMNIRKKCPYCPQIFSRGCDYTKHEKTHTRPYKCPQLGCPYSIDGFPNEKERDRHVNDRHVESPTLYVCQFSSEGCKYASKRSSNLKQHMEKTHGWHYQRTKGSGKDSSESRRSSKQSFKKSTPAKQRSASETSSAFENASPESNSTTGYPTPESSMPSTPTPPTPTYGQGAAKYEMFPEYSADAPFAFANLNLPAQGGEGLKMFHDLSDFDCQEPVPNEQGELPFFFDQGQMLVDYFNNFGQIPFDYSNVGQMPGDGNMPIDYTSQGQGPLTYDMGQNLLALSAEQGSLANGTGLQYPIEYVPAYAEPSPSPIPEGTFDAILAEIAAGNVETMDGAAMDVDEDIP